MATRWTVRGIFQMMRDGTDVTEIREHILFGQMHIGDSGLGGASSV